MALCGSDLAHHLASSSACSAFFVLLVMSALLRISTMAFLSRLCAKEVSPSGALNVPGVHKIIVRMCESSRISY